MVISEDDVKQIVPIASYGFIWIQVRRVRRQIEQIEHALGLLHVCLDHRCLVNRMTIENDEHPRLRQFEGQVVDFYGAHVKTLHYRLV